MPSTGRDLIKYILIKITLPPPHSRANASYIPPCYNVSTRIIRPPILFCCMHVVAYLRKLNFDRHTFGIEFQT